MNQNIHTMLDKSEVKLDLLELYHGLYKPYWFKGKEFHRAKLAKVESKK